MNVSASEYWAVRSMAADAATTEVARAFRKAAVRWLLLKGPGIAQRLYADGTQRPYVDVDALVHPADYEHAESIVEDLGYERIRYSTRRELEHASPWRKSGGADVDLHRSFPHLFARPEAVWGVLSTNATVVRVLREDAPVPEPGALALLVALHALHHGDARKPMTDLERAVARLSLDDWRRAKAIAVELGAERGLAAALALAPGFAALRRDLALPALSRWEVSLRSGENARLAMALSGLGGQRGLRARVGAFYRELVPAKEIVDEELRPDYEAKGRSMIRLRRTGRAVLKLPRAVLAWFVHRRELRLARP